MLFFGLLAAVGLPASAQSVSDVRLEASQQLFAVLAAARTAGIGPSADPAGSPPVLARVDAALASLDPAVVASIKDFLQQQHAGERGAELNAQVSLGLLLLPPPGFEWAIPQNQLPPDVWPLRELPPLLRTFYTQAHLEQLWDTVRPAYEQAIADRQADVAQTLFETRGYLRLIEERYPNRSYTIYLEWLVPPTLVSARSYGGRYSLVLHPRSAEFVQAVRHQYLHFLLDPLAAKYADAMSAFSRLQPLAARVPHLPRAYRDDMLLLATESLIKAIEVRLGGLEPIEASEEITALERAGYLFVRHFFWALDEYEKEEPSIRFYFPELLRGFDAEREQARLKRVEFVPLARAAPEALPVEVNPTTRLLVEADNHMAAGNYGAAREVFQRILRERNPNQPRALYGLAIIASMEQDRRQAKYYFLRTLEQAREPRILGWAHIYLGRIYDLEGDRQQALTHYQAALAVDARPQQVEQAARQGLEHPFGERE